MVFKQLSVVCLVYFGGMIGSLCEKVIQSVECCVRGYEMLGHHNHSLAKVMKSLMHNQTACCSLS